MEKQPNITEFKIVATEKDLKISFNHSCEMCNDSMSAVIKNSDLEKYTHAEKIVSMLILAEIETYRENLKKICSLMSAKHELVKERLKNK